jgi:hypothetical protein
MQNRADTPLLDFMPMVYLINFYFQPWNNKIQSYANKIALGMLCFAYKKRRLLLYP